MDTYTLHQGTAPLFISLPHNGTRVPDDIAARLTPEARRVPDTDWHVAELYDFARSLGASIIVPAYSRYVVDLNRPEDDVSLYPGQNTTGLCPTVRFSGDPANGIDAVQLEIAQRIYMDEESFAYDETLAASAQRAIRALIEAALLA